MYEHRTQPLLPQGAFYRRMARHGGVAVGIIFGSLGIGVVGYHVFARLGWLDALLNASMLLAGMGPVDRLDTFAAKLFAALYALFCGLVYIVVTGVVLTPIAHRMIHHFHLEAPAGRSAK
jgi:hypothetical protein